MLCHPGRPVHILVPFGRAFTCSATLRTRSGCWCGADLIRVTTIWRIQRTISHSNDNGRAKTTTTKLRCLVMIQLKNRSASDGVGRRTLLLWVISGEALRHIQRKSVATGDSQQKSTTTHSLPPCACCVEIAGAEFGDRGCTYQQLPGCIEQLTQQISPISSVVPLPDRNSRGRVHRIPLLIHSCMHYSCGTAC